MDRSIAFRPMNKIEKMFFNASLNVEDPDDLDSVDWEHVYIEPKVTIGPYVVDFVSGKFVIEIDGHDYHKTKEQRDYDYKRERYLMKQGYIVIRFMGTEVFNDTEKCIEDLFEIMCTQDELLNKSFGEGLKAGREGK